MAGNLNLSTTDCIQIWSTEGTYEPSPALILFVVDSFPLVRPPGIERRNSDISSCTPISSQQLALYGDYVGYNMTNSRKYSVPTSSN